MKDLEYEAYIARWKQLDAAIGIAVRENRKADFRRLWEELEDLQERQWKRTQIDHKIDHKTAKNGLRRKS